MTIASYVRFPSPVSEEPRILAGDFGEGIFRGNFGVKPHGIYYSALPDFQKTQFRFFDYASEKVKPIASLEKGVLWDLVSLPMSSQFFTPKAREELKAIWCWWIISGKSLVQGTP